MLSARWNDEEGKASPYHSQSLVDHLADEEYGAKGEAAREHPERALRPRHVEILSSVTCLDIFGFYPMHVRIF